MKGFVTDWNISESKSKQETESLPQFRFAMEEDNEDDYVHVVLDQA